MTLAFDIGGTHMRLAVLTPEGIGTVADAPTPQDPTAALEEFARIARHLAPQAQSAIGGVAGTVSDGVISDAANLPQWNGLPFAALLSKRLGIPVTLVNDAEIAALGEATYGAGKGKASVAYVGLGTGVGTALIRDGKVVPTTSGGQERDMVMTLPDGTWLEDLVGGNALTLRYGVPPAKLPREVWQTLAPELGAALARILATWNPECLVLGGSLMDQEDGFRMEEVVAQLSTAERDRIVPAALGDHSGLWGARAIAAGFENEA